MINYFRLSQRLLCVAAIAVLVSCGSGGGGGSSIIEEPQPDNLTVDWQLDNPVPRGIGSLALGVPTFPREQYMEVISVLKNNFTNHLWDFPQTSSKDLVYNFLAELAAKNHNVTHEIYIINGPGIRGGRSHLTNSLAGKTVKPEEFERLVRSNASFREKLLNEFKRVVGFAKLLEQLGIEILICPVLEDNLSDEGFNPISRKSPKFIYGDIRLKRFLTILLECV